MNLERGLAAGNKAMRLRFAMKLREKGQAENAIASYRKTLRFRERATKAFMKVLLRPARGPPRSSRASWCTRCAAVNTSRTREYRRHRAYRLR